VSQAPASSGNPYANPELLRWVGGMEGVPDWIDPSETAAERLARAGAQAAWPGWRSRGYQLFEMAGTLLPGLGLAGALAVLGSGLAEWIGSALFGLARSPVSPILLAILGGLMIRNALGLPAVYEAGLQLCLKRLLRVGVALLGVRLSLGAVGTIGLAALPVVLACIVSALLAVRLAGRALGVPPRLGTLIAVGTAICGNSAIVATSPLIGAREDETSYAVGCITVFGLLALVAYPFLSHGLFAGDAGAAGLFLGTAIHDTAQVAGAGLLYVQQYGGQAALDTATVTKLLRNALMLAVIPVMGMLHRRDESAAAGRPGVSLGQAVPLFVLGFVALAALRTVGDLGERPFGVLPAELWQGWIASLSGISEWCLTFAMASVGLGTNLRRLRELGLRPLGVGLAAAVLVGAVSFALVSGLPLQLD
jgi:uncharacterized integral membrane protein (TIGR00698 family)